MAVANIVKCHLLKPFNERQIFAFWLLNPQRLDFTQQVLPVNYFKLTKENGTNKKEVESVINHLIADVGRLEGHEVTSEKKIGDDLGIDWEGLGTTRGLQNTGDRISP